LAADLRVPDLDLALDEATLGVPDAAGAGQQLAAGAEGDRRHRPAMADEGADLLARVYVPEDDLAGPARLPPGRRGEVLAVGAEHQAADGQAVTGQRELRRAGVRVPHEHGGAGRLAFAVAAHLTGGGHQGAVRAKRDAVQALRSLEGVD